MANEEMLDIMGHEPFPRSGYTKEEWEQLRKQVKEEVTNCPHCNFRLNKYWGYCWSKGHISDNSVLLLQRKRELDSHIRKEHGRHD